MVSSDNASSCSPSATTILARSPSGVVSRPRPPVNVIVTRAPVVGVAGETWYPCMCWVSDSPAVHEINRSHTKRYALLGTPKLCPLGETRENVLPLVLFFLAPLAFLVAVALFHASALIGLPRSFQRRHVMTLSLSITYRKA